MFCSKCGASVPAGAAFCSNCGQPNPVDSAAADPPVPPVSVDSYAPAPPPAQTWQAPPTVQPAPTVGYAGFWLRFVAFIIDTIIISAVRKALFLPFGIRTGMGMGLGGFFHGGRHPQDFSGLMPMMGLIFRLALIGALVQWLYFSLMESSGWQATLGKKVLGLTVTDLEGRRISFARATGRYFAKIISALTLGIGYIMAGFTEKKQALHDMIAGSLVLRKL